MAGCSSSLGVSRVLSFPNDAVSRKMLHHSATFHRVGFTHVVKEVALSVFCKDNSSRHVLVKKRSKLLIMNNLLDSNDETQFPVGAATVPKEGGESVVGKVREVLESEKEQRIVVGSGGYDESEFDGNGGNGGIGNGSEGGGNGGGDDNGGDKEEEEFGPIMKFEEVMKEAEARGASLPSDMLGTAKSVGIRKVLLLRYLDLQVHF